MYFRCSPVRLIMATLLMTVVINNDAMAVESETPVRIISNRDAKQPQIAVDESGRIFIAFGQGNSISIAISTDGGKSFEVNSVGSAGALSLGMRRGPRVAVTPEAVVITAIGGKNGKGQDGDVLAWRSTDKGKTWAGPTRVNRVESSAREGLHAMVSGPNGILFCTWLDLRNKRTEIYGSLSKDAGTTWEADTLIYRSPDRSVCECCHPSAAFSPDGSLKVMWRNQLKGVRDMYFASSTDGGKTFGEAEKLGQGTWQLRACPMDGGAIAVGPEGQVETIWMRSGSMFSAKPGKPEEPLGRGVQGWAAFGAGGLYRVWLESRPGKLLALSPESLGTITLAQGVTDPVIASNPKGNGPVVVAWESMDGGILALVLNPAGR